MYIWLPDISPTTTFCSVKREMKVLFPKPVKPNSSTPMRSSLHIKSVFRFFTKLKGLVYSLAAETGGGLSWDITVEGAKSMAEAKAVVIDPIEYRLMKVGFCDGASNVLYK